MKKYFLFRRGTGNAPIRCGKFDSIQDAQDAVKDYVEDEEEGTIFDYYVEEREYEEITERVKSYADACKELGITPMNEANMRAQSFRPDEIARRKLETITEALNEGWKPDWANTSERKYYPYFYIEVDAHGAPAGLSAADTLVAASYTGAGLGSRLCFHDHETARYAGNAFKELYEQILIEKL